MIRNSLHKLYTASINGEGNNYTDFDLSEIKTSLDRLCRQFGEEIMNYKVTNLEFGLNIKTSLSPKSILENNFLMYNFDNFSQIETFKNKGYYKQYNRSEYYLKFYDKGLQYKLDCNLLRVEIKIVDSRLLNKLGVKQLSDLTNKDVLESLFNFFIEKVSETNIIDNSTLDDISAKDRTFIKLGKGANYWAELRLNKSSSSFYETRNKFNSILEKYDLLTLKKEIMIALKEKFQKLNNPLPF